MLEGITKMLCNITKFGFNKLYIQFVIFNFKQKCLWDYLFAFTFHNLSPNSHVHTFDSKTKKTFHEKTELYNTEISASCDFNFKHYLIVMLSKKRLLQSIHGFWGFLQKSWLITRPAEVLHLVEMKVWTKLCISVSILIPIAFFNVSYMYLKWKKNI